MYDLLVPFWSHLVLALHVIIAVTASAHVVLFKRDPRSAIGWVGIICLTPFLGSLLYFVFGVNRIRRRARSRRPVAPQSDWNIESATAPASASSRAVLPDVGPLQALVDLSEKVTRRPLLHGNLITPLATGEEAYATMIDAINRAEKSVGLMTYIFDNGRAGKMFLDALRRAVTRGVEVRVLIDEVGSRYSWPPMVGILRRQGIPAASFMPTFLPWRFRYSNLRNHRKILIADGTTGFTGGMNIRDGGLAEADQHHRIVDLHFRIQGPVVAHMQDVFVDDWNYCTGETLSRENWFPDLSEAGPVWARGIAEGPDANFDKLRMILLGAASCAVSSLVVVSPYFLPDDALLTALNVAAMRGVTVDIVLPRENNLSLVGWASATLWPSLLEHGCRIWLTPPPFDHTKLMLVDDTWTLLGSANWDPRSLLLNFEFNIECYDTDLARSLGKLVARKISSAHEVTLQELRDRSLLTKLRDGIVRLASPYL